jgi:hypothetical protein
LVKIINIGRAKRKSKREQSEGSGSSGTNLLQHSLINSNLAQSNSLRGLEHRAITEYEKTNDLMRQIRIKNFEQENTLDRLYNKQPKK